MVEKILEFVREPGINGYGKWGSLNVEQRKLVRELCKSWLIYDDATNEQTKEIERLNNIINVLEEWVKEKQFERIDNIGIYALYETVLQKLQELKGSD